MSGTTRVGEGNPPLTPQAQHEAEDALMHFMGISMCYAGMNRLAVVARVLLGAVRGGEADIKQAEGWCKEHIDAMYREAGVDPDTGQRILDRIAARGKATLHVLRPELQDNGSEDGGDGDAGA